MNLVVMAWGYVALMMAAAEATSPQGTLFGAAVTLLLYGVLPLSVVIYIMATPARKRARRAAEAAAASTATSAACAEGDAGSHATPLPPQGLAPERKES